MDNLRKSECEDESSTKKDMNERKRPCPEGEDEESLSPEPCRKMAKLVASHYNKLKELGLSERGKSRILYMRNFNNWIKSNLINEYLTKLKGCQKLGDPIRVLDMCCGKGGDLLKWAKGGISHLICTDIAEISIEQCKSRYNSLPHKRFSAEFFACDATLVRLRERYKDVSLKLHLVSCQFAFHYSFESLTQADCMVRNASECLAPGGYFIATIPNAFEIMRRVMASENGNSFGNDVYNIEFMCDTERPPLFGAKYQFHLDGVVDCPEFLVYFPALVKLCRKFGLQLERKSTFAEYYKECFNDGQFLLQRMQALQTCDPQRNKDNEEFAHVQRAANALNCRSKLFGTMSKSEWEVATLYSVCAFKKCKNTWDAKGMPVYEFDS